MNFNLKLAQPSCYLEIWMQAVAIAMELYTIASLHYNVIEA